MASPQVETIVVPIAAELELLRKQLAALRVLCSQIGFALDTALLALDEATPPRVVRDDEPAPHTADSGT